ncbi:hypothetical protein EJB05_03354 [Eragrostis curvula]|uniref:GATA-type domain-containing protein n=1 Tax=Eragrostis curvula TaxID=38414 RepID=A0A5J9W7M0_9POAL|nr:hypothetical protein EJB05_03354 [Eragrostis curvula]
MAPEMDSSVEKQGSGSLDPDERPAAGEPKACTECHTTKTPLWRGGPCGPMVSPDPASDLISRNPSAVLGPPPFPICAFLADPLRSSLCNACGIRYRKKRREALGLDANKSGADQQQQQRKKKTKREKESQEEGEVTVELRTVGFGKEVVLKQRRRMRRRRRLGEEERAAILLMALSSGVVYA